VKADDKIIQKLGIKPGQQIADLGCGKGNYSIRFSGLVGDSGMVYAADVNSRSLHTLQTKIRKQGLEKKITIVLADVSSSNLHDNSIDILFSKSAFHHFTEPVKLFSDLKKSLRPGGKIIIIDYKDNSGLISKLGHCSSRTKIDSVMKDAGFSRTASFDVLPKQHFLVYS